MKKILLLVLFLCVTINVRADELHYNIHENEYQYADKDATLEYNIHEGKYEFVSGKDENDSHEHEHESHDKGENDGENDSD